MKSVAKLLPESSNMQGMPTVKKILFFCALILLGQNCGSLIGEVDRIRLRYEELNAAPTVIATNPADNSFAAYNQTYIDVTFSPMVDAGTVTAQSTFGACSGSFQVSYDGFNNCLAGAIDAGANPRIRFTPTIFPKGLGLQIRITSSVTGQTATPAVPYTSPVGFKLGAPCGNQNCFFSYSTPLTAVAGTASWIFPVRAGPHSGKLLVYSSSGTATTLIDPLNVTSLSGKTLCFTPNFGTYSIYVTGGTYDGKELIVAGGGSTSTCLYDHATDTMAAGPALPTIAGAGAGYGGFFMKPQTGGDAGKILMMQGGGKNGVMRFDPTAGTITDAAPMVTTGNTAMQAHAIRLATGGGNAGKHLIYHGVGQSGTTWFDEALDTMTAGPALLSVGTGGGSFEIVNGVRAGQILTTSGSGASTTFGINTTTLASVASPPAVTGGVTSGGRILWQLNSASYDQPLVLHGGGFQTSRYNSSTGNFDVGPLTTGVILDGSASIFLPSTASGGAFLIVNGSSAGIQTPSTSVYFPQSNSFSGTRMPTNVPNAGSNAFTVTGGPRNGKTIIISGALTNETAEFDPLRFDMTRGPQLPSNTTANAFNIVLGSNRVLLFHGNSTTYSLYTPSSDTLSASGGPSLSQPTGAGAVAFNIPGTTKFVVMHGAGLSSGDILDDSNLAAAGSAANATCAINAVPFTIRYKNYAANQERQLVFCNGSSMARFSHQTAAFLSGFSLSGAAGAGMQGFIISSGAHAGKILIVHGGNTAGTTLIDTTQDPEVISGGPTVSAGCATLPNTGAQLILPTTGTNAGRALLLAGNTSADSCFYDPQTHAFVANPAKVGSGVGFQLTSGALAFKTNGGLYPTSFVVLTGANKNVWATYVP